LSSDRPRKIPLWVWPAGLVVLTGLIAFGPRWVGTLRATHGAVATYTELIFAANRQDLTSIRRLSTARYVSKATIREAKEGGVVGLPRNINKNFQAWREGEVVYLCPSNRVGPVYRFLKEDGAWKFDGPAGLLVPGGEFVRSDGEELIEDGTNSAP
jgi:hypothetical protein